MSASRIPRGSERAAISPILPAAAVVLAAAVAVTLAARTRPSFDAYGWLDWGRMTLHGGLDTNAAPSWKPLPWVFTLVYGLLGRGAELWLWMGTVTFVSFAGLVWAGQLAGALVSAGAGVRTRGRLAGIRGRLAEARDRLAGAVAAGVAAVLAGLLLLAVHDQYRFGYLHYVLSSQTDPMIVAFVLGAADCRRRDRPGGAFLLLVAAALGRPEAWPFLLAAGVWLWRARPGLRWGVVTGVVLVAALWFGVPALTSRSWLVAADNAGASGYAPHGDALHRAITVLARLLFQLPWAVWAAAAGGVGVALWRRERTTLGLAGAVLVWVAVEVAFGIHGWPALGRYMFEPAAVVAVIGAAFVGRLVGGGSGPLSAGAPAPGGSALRGLGLAVIGLGLIAWMIPSLVSAGRHEARDLTAQHARTAQLDALARTIDRLGGPARLQRCGEVISAGLSGQTPLAFDVGENVNRVGYMYPQLGHPHNPIVVFRPSGGGWTVRALRQTTAACRGLSADER